MLLKGKKCFCFVALKHHSRFLLPITRVLEAAGVDIRYLTAPAEMPFELALMDEGLPYVHSFSYLTPEVEKEIEAAYRQVRTAWRDKLFTSPILHHFTLPVQDKTLRMQVENFYLFRQMFAQEKPDFVLALHELNSWGKMLGYLSHEYKVPYVTLQEGLYYALAGIYRFHTEYSTACLVWGDATREVLVRSGGSADKIFVVGNTHLAAAIATATQPEAIRETREALHLDPNKKVVSILMGGVGYQEEFAFPEAFLGWARDNRTLNLVCKWHPVTNKTVVDRIQAVFGDNPRVRFVQQYDTYRLLAVSDVCVVFGNSTTGLEALAFGKPLIEVLIPGVDYSFAAQGVAERAESLADVPTLVQQLLTGGSPPERAHHVQSYLDRNLAATRDGKSVERAVEAITSVLTAHEAQREASLRVTEHKKTAAEAAKYVCSIIIPLVSTVGLEETLMGIATHTPANLTYECILSSASPDDVRQLLCGIQGDIRVVTASHAGIAHLCNVATQTASGQYLCFLLPGMIPQAGWLEALLKELAAQVSTTQSAEATTGIVGSKVVLADGSLAHAGVVFDANCSLALLYQLLPATFPGANQTRVVPAVTGSMVTTRELYAAVGGMDEGFQQGWHDVDFCLQAGLRGWQCKYIPHSLCVTCETGDEKNIGDRLRLYGKWVGHLWPNEERYWQEDGLDNKMLVRLYQTQLS
jgi:hypothetical protein